MNKNSIKQIFRNVFFRISIALIIVSVTACTNLRDNRPHKTHSKILNIQTVALSVSSDPHINIQLGYEINKRSFALAGDFGIPAMLICIVTVKCYVDGYVFHSFIAGAAIGASLGLASGYKQDDLDAMELNAISIVNPGFLKNKTLNYLQDYIHKKTNKDVVAHLSDGIISQERINIDAILVVDITNIKAGPMNNDLILLISGKSRLKSPQSDDVLYEKDFTYLSSKNNINAWMTGGAKLFATDVDSGLNKIAEDVVDGAFLIKAEQ